MHFFCTAFIKKIHRSLQLGATNDGIIHQQQLFALNQLRHRNLLLFRHLATDPLVTGRERTAPGGGVFHIGSGKGCVALIGIADGVGNAGIRNAGHIVHFRVGAIGHFVTGHDLTVAIAHDFHIHAFVIGVGIAIIGPQEATDFHLFTGRREGLVAVFGHLYDLLGAKLVQVLVTQLVISKGFKRHAAAIGIFAHMHRQAAPLVTGGNDLAPVCQN